MMTKFALFGAAAALSLGAAANAADTTFVLAGTTGSAASYTYTVGTKTLNVSAAGYNVAPTALTTLAQLSVAAVVQRYALNTPAGNPGGLGVFRTGDGEPQQVDTNGANEALRAGITGKKSTLKRATFNYVDADDTLRLYGVNGGVMTLLGFPGEFNAPPGAPMSGGAIATGGAGTGDNRTWTVNFSGLGSYDSYVFTTNNDSADGYRLHSLTLGVPEPAQWAMLVGGFGLLGAAARRRREVSTVYA